MTISKSAEEYPAQEMFPLRYIGTFSCPYEVAGGKAYTNKCLLLFLQGRTSKNLVQQKNARKWREIKGFRKMLSLQNRAIRRKIFIKVRYDITRTLQI